ncbi:MAG: hypothetical protein K6F84_05770 [Lachnospiraceae bacterium]|nr:hypothetical protein [Lachnospiraceae bacterium]
MSFWDRVFKKKGANEENQGTEWDQIISLRTGVDFNDKAQRLKYVSDCMEQIDEATKATKKLEAEYEAVTKRLTDTDDIEALPADKRDELIKIAGQIKELNEEINKYRRKSLSIKEADYYRIKKAESEIEEGIGKLKEAEDYGRLVKDDLRRLSSENAAYKYRESELYTMINNYRGITLIVLSALFILFIILGVLKLCFDMETLWAWLLSVLCAAFVLAGIALKNISAKRELTKVKAGIRRLIHLENTVKIRYVNNNSLVSYLCMKYETKSSKELKKLLDAYLEEKENRARVVETEGKIDLLKERFLKLLKKYNVRDAEKWLNHSDAILDRREMVELRHTLIQQRQALRKQLDYNSKLAKDAQTDIKEIVQLYPKYASEMLEMIDKYDKQ